MAEVLGKGTPDVIMKVLVACEFSGIVRDAFAARGHDAWSCDLLPSERPGDHIQDDVLHHLDEGWDLMIAHPPCQYLANSGVRWLFNYKGESLESWEIFGLTGYTGRDYRKVNIRRFLKMHRAAQFFSQLLLADIPLIAVENPIQHQYAYASILMRMPFERIHEAQYDQIIHPWQYGHSEKKSTCLWLKNLPKLIPINFVDNRKNPNRNETIWKESPGPERWKNRSRTFQGIAEAMADQWGCLA
jgi:hypothetical protein